MRQMFSSKGTIQLIKKEPQESAALVVSLHCML